ncbi:guanine nucleotide binding protein, alpha subunit [Mycena galopus ATCC 62051]|nr:guanine nucleotide binding protein, alpha subunit [Mycena galopus ATCC 62051]
MSRYNNDDPLDAVLRPPKDETAEEAAIREAREEEARRVSAQIDADIKAERQVRRKKRIVRLLLLGQSESGKSTTLRQFQRLYTPTAFRDERILWRAVIQLNIVRSIRTILHALDPASAPHQRRRAASTAPSASMLALAGPSTQRIPPLPGTTADITDPYNTTDTYNPSYQGGYNSGDDYYAASDPESDPESRSAYHAGGSHFAYNGGGGGGASATWDGLKARLLPLRHVEALLIARLVPAHESEPTRLGSGFAPGDPAAEAYTYGNQGMMGQMPAGLGYAYPAQADPNAEPGPGREREIFVRPGMRWKAPKSESPTRPLGRGAADAERDEPQEALTACAPAMMALWADPGVREVLRRRKIRLEEGPGFFLNDLERVTGPKYLPTDDDVLRARLKTVGVAEYTFEMEVSTGRETGTEWRIVDVGGSRSQRATWVPFFDDVDAIIFLAPIAGFDQVLAEDRTVNRLEDSVLLWKAVCSNKLLAGVDLVLFLNKCDILERKLNAGVKLVRYVRSYADRENSFEAVSQYLRGKFSAIHREYSPNPRKFYAFCTSVTDTATTGGIIASVRDMVVRQHLKQSKLL